MGGMYTWEHDISHWMSLFNCFLVVLSSSISDHSQWPHCAQSYTRRTGKAILLAMTFVDILCKATPIVHLYIPMRRAFINACFPASLSATRATSPTTVWLPSGNWGRRLWDVGGEENSHQHHQDWTSTVSTSLERWQPQPVHSRQVLVIVLGESFNTSQCWLEFSHK